MSNRKAPAKTDWHLVCVTRKGKVSMLKNLDLRTARETYKRLRPDTHPEKHEWCEQCYKGDNDDCWSSFGYGLSGSDADRLERVDVIGPEGVELDPWHGVKPRTIFHCKTGEMVWDKHGKPIGRVPPHPKPEPKWDASRADFWNNPKLWNNLDPTRQLCWMPSSYTRNSTLPLQSLTSSALA